MVQMKWIQSQQEFYKYTLLKESGHTKLLNYACIVIRLLVLFDILQSLLDTCWETRIFTRCFVTKQLPSFIHVPPKHPQTFSLNRFNHSTLNFVPLLTNFVFCLYCFVLLTWHSCGVIYWNSFIWRYQVSVISPTCFNQDLNEKIQRLWFTLLDQNRKLVRWLNIFKKGKIVRYLLTWSKYESWLLFSDIVPIYRQHRTYCYEYILFCFSDLKSQHHVV